MRICSLKRLVDMVTQATEWPIMSIEIPDNWSSDSGRAIIIGDAAHAMTPYMALGAAMAVEDACALAASLSHMKQQEDLTTAIRNWVAVRKPRAKMVHAASYGHGLMLHIEDGSLQNARDEAMKPDIEGINVTESPNQWNDPITTQWAYSYDPDREIHSLWEKFEDNGTISNSL
jgi:salicylate hydroxylase